MTAHPPRGRTGGVEVLIDVIFDTICPWCFIGKRRLEHALKRRPALGARIRWRPFLLNPTMPREGVDRTAYLVRRFGSETRIRRVHGAIAEAGQTAGLDFAFDRILRTPNSLKSHCLVRLAGARGRAADCVESLFSAYFVNGEDIGERDVLSRIAERCGLDDDEVRAYLVGDAGTEAVETENARAHRLGINGVPAFVVNGRHVIAGAQEPAVLMRVLDVALSESQELSAVMP